MADRHANLVVRPLLAADLPSALAIQSLTYPAFLVEDAPAFASRLELSASYCLAATRGPALVAYLLAHGWHRRSPPPLGAVLTDEPAGDVLFLHDLAVHPAERGSGLGRRLVDRAFELAARDGLAAAELIAVEGAAGYWRGLGFNASAASPGLAAKVAAYGPEARWMTRTFP